MLLRPLTKMPGRRPARIALPCLGLILLAVSSAAAAGPLDTVRDFCRLDGGGARVQPRTWARVARLVDWPLEPAWDRVLVISGYQLGTARQEEDFTSIPVTYSLVAEIRPGKVALSTSLETFTYRLSFDPWSSSWRILGPPPPPHLFETEVDTTAMAAALDPGNGQFVSNSAFVWGVLRDRGWPEPYADTAALAELPSMKPTQDPRPGDLAVFYDHHTPFHVGLVDTDGMIVSAALNAGVQRAEPEAFAGEVRYLRPSPADTPTRTGRDEQSTPAPAPTAAVAGTVSETGSTAPAATRTVRTPDRPRAATKRKKPSPKKKRGKKRVRATKPTPHPG